MRSASSEPGIRGLLGQGPDARLPWQARALIAVVERAAPLYRRFGMDDAALLELLETKLLLDDRRRRREGSSGAMNQVGVALMLVFYAVLGIGLGAAAYEIDDPLLYLALVGSLTFLLLLFPLLADFSSILLDTSDIELLSPLPISDRTLVAVRVTHLLGYVAMFLLALGLGPLLLGTTATGGLLMPLMVLSSLLQAALLAVAGVVGFYLLALKTLDLSRFRDALVFVQGGTFVAFYVGMQLGPRMAMQSGLADFAMAHPELAFLLPTTAPGALARWISGGGGALDPWLCLSGFAVTLLAVSLASFLAKGGFIARLALMESSGGRALRKAPRHGITGRLAGRLARGSLERAGWSFFVAQCTSDRQFKLRSIPNMTVMVVPFVLMFVRGGVDELDAMRSMLAYFPYLFLLIVPVTWDMARFAESWEGRWVFDELGERERAELTRGAMKAAIVRYLAVPLLVFSAPVLVFIHLEQWPDLVLAAGLVAVVSMKLLPRYGGEPPFIKKATKTMSGSNMGLFFAIVTFGGLLGLVQFGLGKLPLVIEVLALLSIAGVVRSWRTLCRLDLAPRAGKRGRARRAVARA